MRAFVAVDLPGPPGSAPDHLTLRFLGEIAPDRVAPIGAALAAVARQFAPFEITVDGVGAFPSAAAPRVVWVGVRDGQGELGRLAGEVRRSLRGEGSVEERGPFVAHRTLFRVRTAADRVAAEELLSGRRPAPPTVTVRVTYLALKESVLRPGGAVHHLLGEFPLTGADRAEGPAPAAEGTVHRPRGPPRG